MINKNIKLEDRLIISIDTSSKEKVFWLCNKINNKVTTLKLGLEVLYSNGLDIIKAVISFGYKIMLDVKLMDIPNTVNNAIRALTMPGISIITVHTIGGIDMLMNVKKVVLDTADKLNIIPPRIFGVTILTSLDNDDLEKIGFKYKYFEAVSNLAKLAEFSNIDGIICSPNEVSLVKQAVNDKLFIATPGIRLENDDSGDQKRFNTPYNAIKNGADFIIVGRSITTSENIDKTLNLVFEQIEKALK